MNKALIQTYVWHEGEAFFVSTINRRSSAAASHFSFYAETLVWEWFPEIRKRGELIGQDEHLEDSIFAHQRMVQRLFDTGLCEDKGEV